MKQHDATALEEGLSADAPSDAMLLARAAVGGDNVATGKLVRLLAPRLARVVRAVMGGGHPDLDDTLQQALIAFVQALPAFRGECDPAGYATVIAVRTALAARKRARAILLRHDDQVEEGELVAGAPSPNDELLALRRKEVLRELLTEIPSEQAEALAMRVVLGWSREEIAAHSGAPVNTVRSRLRLAKEALKRRIESDPDLLEMLGVAQ